MNNTISSKAQNEYLYFILLYNVVMNVVFKIIDLSFILNFMQTTHTEKTFSVGFTLLADFCFILLFLEEN